jgi:AcrR family transcriptional regulator
MEPRRLFSYDPPAPVEPSNEERIRDAALTTFAHHGIAATSLRTVAEAAGVSIGLVQHYFGTKASLVAAVEQHVLRTISDALESDPLPTGPTESLNEAGNRIISLYAQNPEVMDYAGHALVEGGAVATKIFDGLLGISASQRDQLTEQQLVRPDLDPLWAALNPLILRLGAVVFRAHIERHLPEPFFTRAQLQRWDTATTKLIHGGHMRDLPEVGSTPTSAPPNRQTDS